MASQLDIVPPLIHPDPEPARGFRAGVFFSALPGALLKLAAACGIVALVAIVPRATQIAWARLEHPVLPALRLAPVSQSSEPFVGRPKETKIDVSLSTFRFTNNWRQVKGTWQVEVLWLVNMVSRDTSTHVATVNFYLDDDTGLRVASLGSESDAVRTGQATNLVRGEGWVDAGLLPLIPASASAIDWEFHQDV